MITKIYEPSLDLLQRKVGEAITKYLSTDEPVLFLSSGGSSVALLEKIDTAVLGPHITIAMVDDRWSTDPKENSLLQLEASSFGKAALQSGAKLISTLPLEGETLEQTAGRFEHDLRNWKAGNPEGKVVITQGMGPDGHTIGILPFPEAPELFNFIFNKDRWVVGYDATGKNPHPYRITVSNWFLRNMVDHSIMYLGSMDKENTLKLALTSGLQAEIPARIIQEMKEVEIFSIFESK
jgi:6-phosphogluconolactonase/glucosamine-6-phosphate isomerase/deaminase